VRVRAPAMAAASAAFWHWLRAIISIPRSSASATKASIPTRHKAVKGTMAPRRRDRAFCLRIVTLPLVSLAGDHTGGRHRNVAGQPEQPGRDGLVGAGNGYSDAVAPGGGRPHQAGVAASGGVGLVDGNVRAAAVADELAAALAGQVAVHVGLDVGG